MNVIVCLSCASISAVYRLVVVTLIDILDGIQSSIIVFIAMIFIRLISYVPAVPGVAFRLLMMATSLSCRQPLQRTSLWAMVEWADSLWALLLTSQQDKLAAWISMRQTRRLVSFGFVTHSTFLL